MTFDRTWSIGVVGNQAKGQNFAFEIAPDMSGRSLRAQFDISATFDTRYYNGTIKIYNLSPTKRQNLAFNILLDEFGTGPSITLRAGYKRKSGIIFDGVVHRGYNARNAQTGDWITTLQVGLPFKQDQETYIPPIVSNAIGQSSGLKNYIYQAIYLTLLQPRRFSIKFAPNFRTNLDSAIDKYLLVNTVSDSLGFRGNAISIIDEISNKFNLIFSYDNSGLNVSSGRYKENGDSERTPITIPDNTQIPEVTINKDSGLIGNPIYTDTGAKIISYLKPELRIFQYIRVESSVLTRNISILELNHRGDTHTDEWYSEIDGANFNQFIR